MKGKIHTCICAFKFAYAKKQLKRWEAGNLCFAGIYTTSKMDEFYACMNMIIYVAMLWICLHGMVYFLTQMKNVSM